MNHLTKFALLLFASVLLVAGCRKKESSSENEGELITTINLKFTPVSGGASQTFTFRDVDGEGGAAPSRFDEISLATATAYRLEMELLDESKTPAENISEEVAAEGDDHQFYFVPGGGIALTINSLDTDTNGLPLGLNSTWTTSTTGNGTVLIVLKHKPGFKAAGDLITVGESDVEISWPIRVQ